MNDTEKKVVIMNLGEKVDELEELARNIVKDMEILFNSVSFHPVAYPSSVVVGGMHVYEWGNLSPDLSSKRQNVMSLYQKWYSISRELVKEHIPDRIDEFENLYSENGKRYSPYGILELISFSGGFSRKPQELLAEFQSKFQQQRGIVNSIVFLSRSKDTDDSSISKDIDDSPISKVVLLCNQFHKVARRLKKRRKDNKKPRPTLEINDEYDVQDLFHALLLIFFSDVRPEVVTPDYAGGSSRMDFILKKEKIVIEIKKTRVNLADKQIGDQLLIDIQRYKEFPDCEILICFVYDPDEYISNPVGLESDLSKTYDGLPVKVVIRTK